MIILKLLSSRTRPCAFLIISFLVLALLVVSSCAVSRAQQTSTPIAQPAAANNSSTLKFIVTVIGPKGGFVTGLTKDAFSVWEGKMQREINYFSGEELPASIGVLIDVSGSVKARTLESARYAVARFIQCSYQKNEYLIGEFNDIWRSSPGWRQDAAATEALNSRATADTNGSQAKQTTRGQTAFYDACAAALDEVVKRPNPKHVLLLVTDGMDNKSRLTLDQLRKKIKASDVQIFGLGITEDHYSGGLDIAGQAILDELATVSGGRAYFPENKKDRKELNEVVERIAVELRHQYMIGFTPANSARGGKWNKVKIKVTPLNESLKSLSVRSREGYFSPPAAP